MNRSTFLKSLPMLWLLTGCREEYPPISACSRCDSEFSSGLRHGWTARDNGLTWEGTTNALAGKKLDSQEIIAGDNMALEAIRKRFRPIGEVQSVTWTNGKAVIVMLGLNGTYTYTKHLAQ